MELSEIKGKKMTVIGAARSGLAAAQLGDRVLTVLGRENVIALETPLELFQQPGGKAEPVCIHRLGGMCGIQGTREFRQAEVTLMMGGQYLVDGIRVVEVHALGQAQANVLFKAPGQVIDLRDLAFDACLHQRGDGGGEQSQHGLLAAAQAGPVAAHQRVEVVLVEQQCFQCADAFVEVIDADVFRAGGRQVRGESGTSAPPKTPPVCVQPRDRSLR